MTIFLILIVLSLLKRCLYRLINLLLMNYIYFAYPYDRQLFTIIFFYQSIAKYSPSNSINMKITDYF